MSSQRPTARDVAERAGVSVATVSFTFSRPNQVRPATRERVLAAASALGYVPSANARSLKTGHTGAIGLYSFDYLLDSHGEPPTGRRANPDDIDDLRAFPLYVDEVQRGVELECRHRGFVLMVGAGGVARHLPAVIDVAGRVDGLIAFAGTAPQEAIAQVAHRIPVVELGGRTRWGGARNVWVDNRAGMRMLVEHLLSAHGLRRLAFFGNPGVTEFAQRYEGFRDALTAAGLPVPAPTPSNPAYPDVTVSSVRRLLLDLAPDEVAGSRVGKDATLPDDAPQALVCATDSEALLVVDTLRQAGVGVPGQVAVTGFDGILAGRVGPVRLTSVRQPMEDLGRTAVRLLAEVIKGAADDAQPDELLPLRLQVGVTCGCPDPAVPQG